MHANPWHEEGFNNAIEYKLMDANSIFILSPGYFLASKFSAFNDRGNNDGRTSKDFEDVVFILQNRKNIWNELNEADPKVKIYLQEQFQRLFQNPYLREWVECHLDRNLENSASWMLQKNERIYLILTAIRQPLMGNRIAINREYIHKPLSNNKPYIIPLFLLLQAGKAL